MTWQIDAGVTGPHRGSTVYLAGEPLDGVADQSARGAVLLLHGRGASAQDILGLVGELAVPGYAYLAPQAAGGSWYPERFIAPLARNEPWLSSALDLVDSILERIRRADILPAQTFLLGFSQGACLALEYAARYPQRYGGVVGLSGALIGPDGTRPPHSEGAPADLAGTPVFLGCGDPDPHISRTRVEQAAAILQAMCGMVTTRIYPGMGHTINDDELDFVRGLMAASGA